MFHRFGGGPQIRRESARHATCFVVGMRGVRRFQDLDAHKLAVQLRREIFRLTKRAPAAKDFKFVGQIRDAARSGARNIAEGFSRFVPAEFCKFLSYAKASLDETKDQIDDGRDSEYFSDEESDRLLTLAERTLAAISRLMKYLESPEAQRAYESIRKARRSRPFRSKNPEPPNPEPGTRTIEP